MVIKIENIDFEKLKIQKEIFINMIQDWGESEDTQQIEDAKEVEGLLNLIDSIQDYAVDVLKIEESKVFNLK